MVEVTKAEFYGAVGPMQHATSAATGSYPYRWEVKDASGRLVGYKHDGRYFLREAQNA